MRFTVVTLFPELFASPLKAGVLGRACESGIIQVDFVNPRDFTHDRHRTVDDTPYGGGPGMVMKVEPLVHAIESVGSAAVPAAGTEAEHGAPAPHRMLLSPRGRPLSQERVRALAHIGHLILICGRYEGMDERVSQLAVDEELSVGDYVLSGGEFGALIVIDAVARHVPGVLGEATSTQEESFAQGLLEYPQYTRPSEFRGLRVPEILQSGHHERIHAWRHEQAMRLTAERRPDLMPNSESGTLDADAPTGSQTYVALAHYPVYDFEHEVVTSSVTNLDIHDIARSAATYDLAGYFVISPVASQRDKVDRIVAVWRKPVKASADSTANRKDNRAEALSLVRIVADIDSAAREIYEQHHQWPLIVATSARPGPDRVDFAALRQRIAEGGPVLLLFGTGWGLADTVLAQADATLEPIAGPGPFNHLSVRSACAIVLDRLFTRR